LPAGALLVDFATGAAWRADPRAACEALRRLTEDNFVAVFLDLDR